MLAQENGIPVSMKGYKWTGPLRPKYPLSRKREVPSHIPRPDYADHRKLVPLRYHIRTLTESLHLAQGVSQIEQKTYHQIKTLNGREIEGMRKVCKVGETS